MMVQRKLLSISRPSNATEPSSRPFALATNAYSPDADAEMIAMVIDCLKAAGLKEFQVELGEVAFYRSLLQQSGLDEDAQAQLNDLIENKNRFGVEEFLKNQDMEESLKEAFLKLPELFGGINQIKKAKALTDNPQALAAIERLERVHTLLEEYHMADYVSYDLGMLTSLEKYSGSWFRHCSRPADGSFIQTVIHIPCS